MDDENDFDSMGLSDEELAALEDDDEAGDDDAPVADAFGDDDDDDDEQEAAADEAPPAVADTPADEPAPREEGDALLMPVADVAAIKGSLDEVRAQKEALRAAYQADDSDMTSTEYEAKLEEINDRILDLRAELNKAELFAEMNEQVRVNAWKAEVRAFMRGVAKDEGLDYNGDKKLLQQFDTALKVLGNDPDNADKSGDWFLTEAHEMVKARNRIAAAPARSKGPELTPVERAIAARREKAQNGREVPRTLSHVPQAAIENEGGGEFAHLDKLSGMDLELALARMTPEQEQRWLNS